jgi:hypothetical protein
MTEIAQFAVPGRTASYTDGLLNIAGVLFGIVVTNVIMFCVSKPKADLLIKRDILKVKAVSRQPAPKTELHPGFFYNPGPTP